MKLKHIPQWIKNRIIDYRRERLDPTDAITWMMMAEQDYKSGRHVLDAHQLDNLLMHAMKPYGEVSDVGMIKRMYARMDEHHLVHHCVFSSDGDRLRSWQWQAVGVSPETYARIRKRYASGYLNAGFYPSFDESLRCFDPGVYEACWEVLGDDKNEIQVNVAFGFTEPKTDLNVDQFRDILILQNLSWEIPFLTEFNPDHPWDRFGEIRRISDNSIDPAKCGGAGWGGGDGDYGYN